MHITVAICTWNRAELLGKTLSEMQELRIPEGVTWELLVVDNNSTDDTAAVVQKYVDSLPIRYLLERMQGLSHARNCAVAEAAGELMLWTDDDVLVDPDWLASYVAAARENPEATIFGGPIEPWFETEPPEWVVRHLTELDGPFAVRSERVLQQPLSRDNLPFGANMAFRTVALKGVPFDPRLGRKGTGMLSGDETALFRTLFQNGATGCWVPRARVRHFVASARITARYIYRFFRGVAEGSEFTEPEASLDRYPRWCVRIYYEALLERGWRSIGKDGRWLAALKRQASADGRLRAWRARYREHRAALQAKGQI